MILGFGGRKVPPTGGRVSRRKAENLENLAGKLEICLAQGLKKGNVEGSGSEGGLKLGQKERE